MPAGRPPLPDEHKIRKGTYKPSRATGKEVAVAPKEAVKPKKRGRPRKHKEVNGLTVEAQKMFDESVQILTAYRMLTDYDIHMITMMCHEYDTYIKVKDTAPIEYNPETGVSMVPAGIRVKKMALDSFMTLAQSLNLTSVMRMRIRIKEEEDQEDPMAKFI
jgi:phage terminase small subunit